jgi:hypothetical protein
MQVAERALPPKSGCHGSSATRTPCDADAGQADGWSSKTRVEHNPWHPHIVNEIGMGFPACFQVAYTELSRNRSGGSTRRLADQLRAEDVIEANRRRNPAR